ncbi:TPA_asm: hypothetical protein vir520_00023 [Caudoviricetes sp. vir520]|nr:TPA_asm: hypothetical protein vir520_00023 [Caudoviricetes sp. vir520]
MSKIIRTYSIDPKVVEEFDKRIPKNERSKTIEDLMRSLIKNNKYQLEKTRKDLERARSEVNFLEEEIKKMEIAREQETLSSEMFDDLWKGELRNLLLWYEHHARDPFKIINGKVIYYEPSMNGLIFFRKNRDRMENFAKRCKMSLLEFDQACLEKLNESQKP